jgi:hypothetical protein
MGAEPLVIEGMKGMVSLIDRGWFVKHKNVLR